MRNQKGFTLIELIIVIVVLGILAVTAAPQFIDFSSDARQSALKGARGSINGAIDTVYGRAQIDGVATGEDTVNVNGVSVDIYNGYPKSSELATVAGLSSDEWAIVNTAGTYSGTLADGVSVITFSSLVGTSPSATDITGTNCYVEYNDKASADTRPTITVYDTGC